MKIVFAVDNLIVNYNHLLWPNLNIVTKPYSTDYDYICTLINNIILYYIILCNALKYDTDTLSIIGLPNELLKLTNESK